MFCHCEIFCIMWQLHFSKFLNQVFIITLEIRCYLVRSNYVRKYETITLGAGSSFLDYFLWYVSITYWNNVTATFHFRLSLWRTFITSQLRYLFVQMVSFFDDVRIKMVLFFDDVGITLNYGNCWNVRIMYGSYVIKW